MNTSFIAFVGDPIIVPEDIQVVIKCGQVIGIETTQQGIIANITWYKNGRSISNDTEVNVLVAGDHKNIIITDTLLGTPAQVGTDGNYSCQVCTVYGTCLTRHSIVDVCGKYHLIM